jgi:anaerobic magnesium-protoporphyrin IX monomethyl ester cyclase
MSNVVLFNSAINFQPHKDIFETSPLFIRYGIASIAGFLRKNKVKVEIIEPAFLTAQQIKDKLISLSPDYAGISSFTSEIFNVGRTMDFVKNTCPKIKTVIGHAHVSALPVETLNAFPSFDIGVIGEGEMSMLEIVTGKRLQDINGLVYRNDGKIVMTEPRQPFNDLSVMGIPAFDLYGLTHYCEKRSFLGGKILNLPVETSRGCSYSCLFCFRTIGKKMRHKDYRQVADELGYYINKFPVERIAFIDATFGVDKALTLKLCEEIIRRKISKKIKWNAGVRANNLDEEMIRIFAQSGCRVLGLGVESGNNAVLSSCGKGITTQDIIRTVNLCKKFGIFVEAYFIFGLPGDTRETIKETISFASRLGISGANFAILVPFPGTQVYEWAKSGENGYRLTTDDYSVFGKQSGSALTNENLAKEELLDLQTQAYKIFYTSNPKRFMQFIYHLDFRRLMGLSKRYSAYSKSFTRRR